MQMVGRALSKPKMEPKNKILSVEEANNIKKGVWIVLFYVRPVCNEIWRH